ncbi:hypothetical protein HY031_01690 [Candidatus Gottesmanbacteria bacterium]|nr:hypothetical protein [Candidatus Gottesmanbacteria bacterium]
MKIHSFHFLVLLIILVTGLVLLYITRGNPTLQMSIGVTTSVAYVLWGIIHHTLKGDLHLKIVIEYILIGGIAIALLRMMVI